MLEIYNEQVRDLLNPASLKIKGGLKVRESTKQGGFYGKMLNSCTGNCFAKLILTTRRELFCCYCLYLDGLDEAMICFSSFTTSKA